MTSDDRRSQLPEVGELLQLIEQLDIDNERLRERMFEFMVGMEDAVTAQVAAERALDACRRDADDLAAQLDGCIGHADGLTVQLDALQGSRSWRIVRWVSERRARLSRLVHRVPK